MINKKQSKLITIEIPNNAIFKEHKNLPIKKINLLYGSNGTGKTMLSRVFALIDEKTNLSTTLIKEDIKPDLKIINNDFDTTIVYNADFVDYHFNFKENINEPLSVNLKNQDDEVTSSKEELRNLKIKKVEKLSILKSYIKRISELDTQKNQIKDIINNKIRDHYNNGVYPKVDGYDNALKKKIEEIMDLKFYDTIKEYEYKKAHQELIDANSDKKEITDRIKITLISLEKYNEIKNILEEKFEIYNETQIDNYLKKLEEDKLKWIKNSLDYIKENDKECPLCKQDLILKDYITGYISYFEKIKDIRINKLKDIQIEKINLSPDNLLYKIEDQLINDEKLGKMQKKSKDKITEEITFYNSKIVNIIKQIKEKEINPEKIINILPYESIVNTINENVENLNSLIEDVHNKRIPINTNNTNKNVSNIKTVIKYNLQEEGYFQIKNELYNMKNWGNLEDIKECSLEDIEEDNNIDYTLYNSNELIESICSINIEIEKIENSLKKKKDAATDINIKLKEIWGYNKIELKLNETKDAYNIELKNNNQIIFYPTLSEGEKTSITLAYFLTKLESLMNEQKEQKLLIYIDDPISSLDNYIVYKVSEILIDLKTKLVKNNSEYPKLFISTHNWYLFYLINRHNIFATVNAYKEEELSTFNILKNKNNKTVIKLLNHEKIPSYFGEYKIVFKDLYKFIEQDIEEVTEYYDYFGISNKARKVLEDFMYFKYGKSKLQWEDKEFVKIHDALCPESHSNGIIEIPINKLQENIKQVLEKIKSEDKSHYDAMIS